MSSNPKPRHLSDVVRPGEDFAKKVKITAVLDREVLVTGFEKTSGSPEFNLVDPDTGEIVIRDYWNVTVVDADGVLTFSTGAVPVDKVLTALQSKLDRGEAELPVLATFRKEGRTYIVE